MSITADYDWALTGLWHAHVGGAWRWIGPLWALLVESRSLGGAPTLELPAYSILDLNTSLATGRWFCESTPEISPTPAPHGTAT